MLGLKCRWLSLAERERPHQAVLGALVHCSPVILLLPFNLFSSQCAGKRGGGLRLGVKFGGLSLAEGEMPYQAMLGALVQFLALPVVLLLLFRFSLFSSVLGCGEGVGRCGGCAELKTLLGCANAAGAWRMGGSAREPY